MSERNERTPNSDADRSPEERINDPPEGLARLRQALKHILKVPKEAIGQQTEETAAGRYRSTHAR